MSLLDRVQRKAEEAAPAAPAGPPRDLRPAAAPERPAADEYLPGQVPPPEGWLVHHATGHPEEAASPGAPAPTTPAGSPPPQKLLRYPPATPLTPGGLRPGVPAAPAPARPVTPESPGEPAARQTSLLHRTGLTRSGSGRSGGSGGYAALRAKVHQRLVDEIADNAENVPAEAVRQRIAELVNEVVAEQSITMTRQERQRVVEVVVHDVLGLGPLEDLLANPEVTEIMVNSHKQIYIERNGRLTASPVTFESNEHLMQVIDRIVSSIGRRVDESSPMVDARLKDGSRVNVIIPPLALRGPTVTIRKFAKEALQIEDLVRFGSITDEMVQLIRSCVRARLNVVVSGGTGSGKTTTLNILSSFIPADERIVTIEDAAELQLRQDHVVTLETRPANVEGRGRISIRDLVINSLRMRPDRIVVGECRGGEALDMLQAMNTGHDGSLTTLHANNPRDAISRLETLVLMAGAELPSRAIREQIGSAVDVIVHQSRLRDGTRKIVSITEVLGCENNEVRLQEVFAFKQTGYDEEGGVIGGFMPTGVVPRFMEHLIASGEGVSEEIFQPVRMMEAGGNS